jgi:hypothetical protein
MQSRAALSTPNRVTLEYTKLVRKRNANHSFKPDSIEKGKEKERGQTLGQGKGERGQTFISGLSQKKVWKSKSDPYSLLKV